ncbi:glycoside hydrolase family 76 protein [Ophiostoma piceae UAMH 11346]|uniref:Glycoside hydrolase family 76 protein n=1 Tax=Ophiostoma piceae (strain UAMH 11346) TaxID=1262450 RepID=S3BPK4_OPHP1|nr:glycoside hydrolase family 76 protein [Ophiostoma piceae UAMH 11346]
MKDAVWVGGERGGQGRGHEEEASIKRMRIADERQEKNKVHGRGVDRTDRSSPARTRPSLPPRLGPIQRLLAWTTITYNVDPAWIWMDWTSIMSWLSRRRGPIHALPTAVLTHSSLRSASNSSSTPLPLFHVPISSSPSRPSRHLSPHHSSFAPSRWPIASSILQPVFLVLSSFLTILVICRLCPLSPFSSADSFVFPAVCSSNVSDDRSFLDLTCCSSLVASSARTISCPRASSSLSSSLSPSSYSLPSPLTSYSPTLLYLLSLLYLPPIMVVNGGSFAARALSLLSARINPGYADDSGASMDVLQKWYNSGDGLWDTTGWWNSANVLTVLGDFARRGGSSSAHHDIIVNTMSNTFSQAQQVTNSVIKTVDTHGLVHSTYTRVKSNMTLEDRGFHSFINDYYDDEGWWALAWIRAYDVTNNLDYLNMAITIVNDMTGGWSSTPCGGGIWWSKDKKYKNAIANELYLAVVASLANRLGSQKDTLVSMAVSQWQWFQSTGMINSRGSINDGLTINDDGSCVNNNDIVWSYNQGVILGGLVELYTANGDTSLIASAVSIAKAAISELSVNGILHDGCDRNGGSCGADGATFKGVFLRNLGYLVRVDIVDNDSRNQFKTFIQQNADSIWNNDRNSDGQLGLSWSGPPDSGNTPNAGTHASAMDCLVAAASVL